MVSLNQLLAIFMICIFARCYGSTALVCPTECQCLSDQTVVVCNRAGLIQVPRVSSAATTLELDYNHISIVQNGSLHRTPHLLVLSLHDNGILYLEAGVFDALRDVRVIRIGRNHISSLPRNIFANNRRLEVLDFHANYFAQLPDDAMFNLGSLQVLNASFNQLTSAALGPGFEHTRELRNIDLSGNNFLSIDSRAFESMHSWNEDVPHHINLSYCNIWHIDPLAFDSVPSIYTFSLQGNPHITQDGLMASLANLRVESLEDANFSHMNITDVLYLVRNLKANTLKYLQLAYNRIRRVPKRTFFFYVNLRRLDLAHNQIAIVENFAGLSKLEYLNLAYNSLDSLDEMMFEGLHELKTLDISHNALTQLSDEPFLNLFNLNAIDVSANQIQTFQISAGLESLEVLRASWNRISNLRFLQHLRRLRTLDLSHNAISRLPDEIFSRGQSISCANFSYNAIFEIGTNTFQSVSYETLDLSRNRLTSLANHGMENVQILYAQENNLYNVTASAFTGVGATLRELHLQRNNLFALSHRPFANLCKLAILDLSSNPIGRYVDMSDPFEFTVGLERLEVFRLADTGTTHISPTLLSGLSRLKQLDLSRNKLHELSASMLARPSKLTYLNLAQNNFRAFDADVFADLPELEHFDLSKNPMDCTCDLVPLCRRLFAGDIVDTASAHNRTLYQCRTPDEWLGVSIAEFHADSAQCSYFIKIVIVVAVVSAILVVAATLVLAIYRYKTWKKHKIVVLNRRTINYKFVDETSLTNTSNSSNKSDAPILISGGGTPKKIIPRQWV